MLAVEPCLAFFPRPLRALRSARLRLRRACCKPPELRRIRSAPTISAATCFRASSAPTAIDMQIAVFATTARSSSAPWSARWSATIGGWPDALFGRLVDAVITFPFLVLVIAIVAVLGPGLINMYIAVGVVGWVFYARLMRRRSACRSRLDYAAAARVMGYSRRAHHLSPPAAQRHHPGDRLLDDRHGAGHPARIEPRLSRARRAAAAAEWGVLIADGKNFMTHGLVDLGLPGHRHRRSPASASACSATASPTCCGRAIDERAPSCRSRCAGLRRTLRDARAARLTAVDGVDLRRRARARCWAWSAKSGSGKSVTLRSILRLVPPPGRVERLGRPGAAATWSAMPERRSAAGARARDRDDLPGADDGAQPGADRAAVQIDENLKAHTALGRRARPSARVELLDHGRHSGRGGAPRRLSAPVLRRHAPAGDDRHRARELARASCSPTSRRRRSTSPSRTRSCKLLLRLRDRSRHEHHARHA